MGLSEALILDATQNRTSVSNPYAVGRSALTVLVTTILFFLPTSIHPSSFFSSPLQDGRAAPILSIALERDEVCAVLSALYGTHVPSKQAARRLRSENEGDARRTDWGEARGRAFDGESAARLRWMGGKLEWNGD